ncbi:hypothetical protein [Tepidicella xavieri]|uniref:Uncharacterized protein n=1 Tax=Tepidicella xavieri TaxID=360241 RepID=A0A4R6U8A8_9BURK|nr:hypothetical protein [Tepidicella xavieri]TDQ39294.1 hypothetical protein DFR43_11940 [Tepidicella xavieri]
MALIWLAAGAMSACTPAFNWRQVTHDGVAATLLMPCKPERAEREVRLQGEQGPASGLKLMSCRTGGLTWAWAALPLPAEMAPASAAEAWMRASWASLRQPLPAESSAPVGWVVQVPQRPAAPWAQRWHGPGLDHRQQPLQAHVLVVVANGWLHQAAVYAEPPAPSDPLVIDTFFESLTLR